MRYKHGCERGLPSLPHGGQNERNAVMGSWGEAPEVIFYLTKAMPSVCLNTSIHFYCKFKRHFKKGCAWMPVNVLSSTQTLIIELPPPHTLCTSTVPVLSWLGMQDFTHPSDSIFGQLLTLH